MVFSAGTPDPDLRRSHSRKLILGCPTVIMVLYLCLSVACGDAGPEKDPGTVFRYNESKGIATLDPAFARNQTIIWPVNQIFNGLVQMDRQLNVSPCIARSWDISEDGLSYRFHLRNDVFFHDHPIFPGGKGRRVTAMDFAYSFSRIQDPALASPGLWIFNHLDPEAEGFDRGCRALNDSVLEIRLKHPFPAFLGILTMSYCSVVPREVVEHYGPDFRRNPVGTGPFLFKFWKEGEKMILLKNPEYFEFDSSGQRLPYLDAINIRFISDKQSEFLEFMKHNLDFLSGVHSAYKKELLTRAGHLNPKYNGIIRMQTGPYLNTEYLGFQLDTTILGSDTNPLLDVRIRKAINHGFDRQKMIAYLRNNLAEPATEGMVPEGLPSFTRELVGFDYQPGYSARLLVEAGYPGGQGLPGFTLTTTSDYLDLCEYIQHELQNLGIRMNIEVSAGAVFRENVAKARLPFFRASWIADYPDAENYLALFYSRNFTPQGPNYTRFSHAKFDQLYENALTERNDSLRYEYYRQMDQIILDEAAVVPLYYDRVVRFAPENITGLEINPLNLLVLKKVKKNTKSQ